jgi:hypothetical protein
MPSGSLTSSVTSSNLPTLDFGYYAGDTSGPDEDGYHTCAMVMEPGPKLTLSHRDTSSSRAHFLTYDASTDELELGCQSSTGSTNIGGGGTVTVDADLTVTGTTTLESGITNTAIGASSPSTGAFTTLSASAGLDSTIIGASTAAAGSFTALTATGTTTIATVDLNGGAIDGTTVGAAAASTGAFTTLSASSGLDSTIIGASVATAGTFTALTATGTTTIATVDIAGGAIDGTTIGASSPSTGAFTTLSASSGLDSTVIGASTATAGTFTALTATGTTTIATVDIAGGAIDGTTIGATSPAIGTFTETNVTSDRRLKENIQEHDRVQIHANVMRLKGVDYNLIADAGKEKNSGFIAQEVEEVFPQFVKENSNGIKSVNYSQMTSVLLSALQHQQTTIEMLETRILSLENHTSSITEL